MKREIETKNILFRRALLAGLLTAAGVALSVVSIPVGPTRCFPFQHAINVMAGVILGPFWAAGAAFTTSLIRNLLGTGSLFAFPGSIFGALAVGTAAYFLGDRHKMYAALAEPFGTGVVGAWVSAAIAGPVTGTAASFAFFSFSFLVSSIPGALIGAAVLYALEKRGLIGLFVKPKV